MNKMELLESISRIIDCLHNAMDEIEEIEDNIIPKERAQTYITHAEVRLTGLMDDVDELPLFERSGAV